MTMRGWSSKLQESLAVWLGVTLTLEQVEAMVPDGDALRTWWSPEPSATAIPRLTALVCGGEDHLTLLALVQQARVISPPPKELDHALSIELRALAERARSTAVGSEFGDDTFLSYAHEDTERALAIGRLLAVHGVRLFRDVERIRPGESITTRLHQVMTLVDSAVVIVSRFSQESEWVDRELRQLVARRETAGLTLLPILLDDVPLPELVADLFTIDLRGYGGSGDDTWADPRLEPLVQRLRAGRQGRRPPRTRAVPAASTGGPMRFEVESSRMILDDFFKVEEARVRYERFDGSMTGAVRRLCFLRGDSVAAILVNRVRRDVILIKQFRYATCTNGPGWVIEAIAGMVEGDEAPETAIRREIEEEAGFRVDDLITISTFYTSPGGSSERITLFCADVDESSPSGARGGVKDEGEDIQVLSFPIDEIGAMLAAGEIADAKTIIGLQWLVAGGRERAEADREP